MAVPFTEPGSGDLAIALAERDPETLVGPLLWLLTRLARGACAEPVPRAIECALVAHLSALAAHPLVAVELRLAAGALAIEHRR